MKKPACCYQRRDQNTFDCQPNRLTGARPRELQRTGKSGGRELQPNTPIGEITTITNLISVPRETHEVQLPQDRILHGREQVLNVVNTKETLNMLVHWWITLQSLRRSFSNRARPTYSVWTSPIPNHLHFSLESFFLILLKLTLLVSFVFVKWSTSAK